MKIFVVKQSWQVHGKWYFVQANDLEEAIHVAIVAGAHAPSIVETRELDETEKDMVCMTLDSGPTYTFRDVAKMLGDKPGFLFWTTE